MAIDPICGMRVDEASALSAERGGQRFYFCSDGCRQQFLSQPAAAKAAVCESCEALPQPAAHGKHATTPSGPPASNPVYTCPMHPEVAQDKPSGCPKCGMALDRLEKVTTLVVDKTGTLTEGKPKLIDVLPTAGFDAKDLLLYAASLEQSSEHPLAAAIVRGAKEQGASLDEVQDFRSVTAGGVAGTVGGRAPMIGKTDFLRNEGIAGLASLETSAVKLQEDGKTVTYVAIDGKPAGILSVADPIKASTAEAIDELHALGLKIVMLTGDNRRTAAAVAKQLGLDGVDRRAKTEVKRSSQ
jgi:magnesium-transporting ATPase (P-type)/YHS domain-containing protein